jgi:hypothetical protein
MSEKIGNQLVKVDEFMVGILKTLVSEREFAGQEANKYMTAYKAAQTKIDQYLIQCAGSLGIANPVEWTFSDQAVGFVPKPVLDVSEVIPSETMAEVAAVEAGKVSPENGIHLVPPKTPKPVASGPAKA